jgi:hypothetical protein
MVAFRRASEAPALKSITQTLISPLEKLQRELDRAALQRSVQRVVSLSGARDPWPPLPDCPELGPESGRKRRRLTGGHLNRPADRNPCPP